MITVRISKKENTLRAVSQGHSEGNEILCAAATCLMNTFRGAIENLTESGKVKAKLGLGKYDIRYISQNDYDDAAASLLMNNLVIGILQLQETYPGEIALTK